MASQQGAIFRNDRQPALGYRTPVIDVAPIAALLASLVLLGLALTDLR